ncbi:MAG: hypothetical protein RL226_1201 [Bacteroidota bacterium]|jgi:uncharacterized SAM-binding protein YcdF (DUF218 family)
MMLRRPIYKRRWFIYCAGLSAMMFLLFLFHQPLLRGVGNFLIRNDKPVQADALVVLGGNSYERGLEAERLYQAGMAPLIVCTGGNIPSVFLALDTVVYESELTRSMMIRHGVPAENILALTSATSTREEAMELVQWATDQGIQSIVVVSSAFHTRRVGSVFDAAFDSTDVAIFVHPAPPVDYSTDSWWTAESGLIMVFNEYAKTLYYFLK